jgi:hypothetical protein
MGCKETIFFILTPQNGLIMRKAASGQKINLEAAFLIKGSTFSTG